MIADLSVNYVERKVLECGYVLQETVRDYGIDVTLSTFDDAGEVENGLIEIQLKATDDLPLSADARTILQRVSTRDLKSWLFELLPVVLIVYDAENDWAYWLHVQDYGRSPGFDVDEKQTVTLKIPIRQRVTPAAVRAWRLVKNREWQESLQRKREHEADYD